MSGSQNSSLPMSCFLSINDDGAALIQSGSYIEAATLLSGGLRDLRQIMVASKASQSGISKMLFCQCCSDKAESQGRSSLSSSPLSMGPCSPPAAPSSCCSDAVDGVASNNNEVAVDLDGPLQAQKVLAAASKWDDAMADDSNEPFLFSAPLYFGQQKRCCDVSRETIVFAMMYNLSLSFDLKAESPEGTAADKSSALRLYSLAYEMRMHEQHDVQVPLLYLCGMVNNMCRLHSYFHNDAWVEWCVANLMRILAHYKSKSLQLNGDVGATSKTLEDYYFDQFYNSASTMLLPGSNTAAAA